jgi:hypothetical protein
MRCEVVAFLEKGIELFHLMDRVTGFSKLFLSVIVSEMRF